MVKILVFGDSIAWGAFDSKYGGWVSRLKSYFLKEYNKTEVGVYNLAVSSNDTRGVLKFLENDINKITKIEKEDLILLFSIGSNDLMYFKNRENINIDLLEFERNLKEIIEISKKYSKIIIFTGLLKVNDKLTQPWHRDEYWENRDIKIYDEVIRKICEQEKVIFLEFLDLIKENDLEDGLHPDAIGHEKIFYRVRDYLINNMKNFKF